MSGNLPNIRNDKDMTIIEMKLRGERNSAIANTVGMKLKTVQNTVAKGGRLYDDIQLLRSQKALVLGRSNVSLAEKLSILRNKALDEINQTLDQSNDETNRLRAAHIAGNWSGMGDEKNLLTMFRSMPKEKAREKVSNAWYEVYGEDLFVKESSENIILNNPNLANAIDRLLEFRGADQKDHE